MRKKIITMLVAIALMIFGVIVVTADFSCGEDPEVATTEEEGPGTDIVGGPCEYQKYPGICHADSSASEESTYFTFKGTVGGKEVLLSNNDTNADIKIGDDVACSLEFITKGTCTPCGFDMNGEWGSCGVAAWDFFRTMDKN